MIYRPRFSVNRRTSDQTLRAAPLCGEAHPEPLASNLTLGSMCPSGGLQSDAARGSSSAKSSSIGWVVVCGTASSMTDLGWKQRTFRVVLYTRSTHAYIGKKKKKLIRMIRSGLRGSLLIICISNPRFHLDCVSILGTRSEIGSGAERLSFQSAHEEGYSSLLHALFTRNPRCVLLSSDHGLI